MDEAEKVVEVQDVLCLAVPESISNAWTGEVGLAETLTLTFGPALTKQAYDSVWAQWAPGQGPDEIEFEVIEWLVTNTREQIEQFQPAHDCAECRAGNDQAEAFLREHPGRYVAMANITYVEYWVRRQP